MRLAVLAAILMSACASEPAPRVCAPFDPTPGDPLSLEAARDARRWAALTRRFQLEEARAPGYTKRAIAARVPSDGATPADTCFSDLYVAGRLIFEHPFAREDGLGNELSAVRARNPFRRVHEDRFGGPETNHCRSCHWRGGRAGAGDLTDAAMVLGDGSRTSGADARNPPALHGAGAIEALAREMSADLAVLREEVIAAADAEGSAAIDLVTHGVSFGVLRADRDGVDASGVIGVDADLIVRPFGWKGTFAGLREIASAAFQMHLGIQSAAAIREGELSLGDGPRDDPDRDGYTRELGDGELDAVVAFLASQAVPIMRPHERIDDLEAAADGFFAPTSTIFFDEWARGRAVFDEVGCASCHVPSLVLRDPVLPIGEGGFELDLSREAERPRIAHDAAQDGYPIFLFSDLRRHDLGPENASIHEDRGVHTQYYLTRPLWGLADSAPYFHDGRSPSIDDAILRHGGEAAPSRDAFTSLPREDRAALRVFLVSLRRAWRPTFP
jgi:hypothetical protein